MGGGYGVSVAPVKESSLAAVPGSQWLRIDSIAKGSTIAMSARLSNKLARADRSSCNVSIGGVVRR